MEGSSEKVWLSTPTYHEEEIEYITEAIVTNWKSTVGKNIDEAEQMIAEKIGCKYAVALSSGTAALHLAVIEAGVGKGDYVLCSGKFYCLPIFVIKLKIVKQFIDIIEFPIVIIRNEAITFDCFSLSLPVF